MTTKITIPSTLQIIAMCILSACGQTDTYPPLTPKDFDYETIDNETGGGKYTDQYLVYRTLTTYDTDIDPEPRETPLPWDMKPAAANDILQQLAARLALQEPEFNHEQRYVMCGTSVPETQSEAVRELLSVELAGSKLVDAAGTPIAIDTHNGITVSYSSLFEENGIDYQYIGLRVPYADADSRFDQIAKGFVNIKLNLAESFDKTSIDKAQRGKTITFDGVQVTLLEMSHNIVHLKLSAANAQHLSDWELIPCTDGKPMNNSSSSINFPFAFYDFARKNTGLSYTEFETQAAANETAWRDAAGDRYHMYRFDCPVTSLYLCKSNYVSVEKRIDIKGGI